MGLEIRFWGFWHHKGDAKDKYVSEKKFMAYVGVANKIVI